MANPIFAYQDLSRYTLSATSTNASFPLTNLQTYVAADVWKSASTSTQSLVIDFGAARSIDFCVIENYSFGGADTAVLQGASDSGFTTGLVTPINPFNFDSNVAAEYYPFSAQSKRYWRVLISIATPPMTTNPFVGNLFLGARLDFGVPYDFPYKVNNPSHETTVAKALSGLIRTAQPFGGRKTFKLSFGGNGLAGVSDATKTAFQTFFATVRGRLRPFYFIDTDNTVYYVHLDLDEDPTQPFRVSINNLNELPLFTQLTS